MNITTSGSPSEQDDRFHVLVVEDEPAAQRLLLNYIERVPSLHAVAVCNDALEASALLHRQRVDIVFCDVKMPHLSGIDFIRTLQHPPAIVLTTAYSEYALEGYELDIVDYLLKPFSFERFLKAVNKSINTSLARRNVPMVAVPEIATDSLQTLMLHEKGRSVEVRSTDILYVEGYGNYVRIHTERATHVYESSLSALEEMLPRKEFVRIHKSFIIACRAAHTLGDDSVIVGQTTLPVGRNYKFLLADRLREFGRTP